MVCFKLFSLPGVVVCLTLLAGCGKRADSLPADGTANEVPAAGVKSAETPAKEVADEILAAADKSSAGNRQPPLPDDAWIVVEGEQLSFSPKTVAVGQAGFGFGLGHIVVNVLGRENGQCIFDYTKEVEGGFAVYRMQVPVDAPPVRVYTDNGGLATSFTTDLAKVVRDGNLHLGLVEPQPKAIAWQQQPVGDTPYVNSFALLEGKGQTAEQKAKRRRPIESDRRVVLRYRVNSDEFFETPLPGFQEPRTLEFAFGSRAIGPGIKAAVQALGIGDRARVLIREEVAGGITDALGGVQKGTRLPVEIELVSLK